jgi:hypothetical protein
MTAEELKAKRMALGFGCRNALAKALGENKYAVEHREYSREAARAGCGVFFDAGTICTPVGPRQRN